MMDAGNTICLQTGKRRHTTPGEAKRFMRTLRSKFSRWLGGIRNKRGRTKPKQKRIYFCPFCKGYHLTSQDKMFWRAIMEQKKVNERLEGILRLIR